MGHNDKDKFQNNQMNEKDDHHSKDDSQENPKPYTYGIQPTSESNKERSGENKQHGPLPTEPNEGSTQTTPYPESETIQTNKDEDKDMDHDKEDK